MNAVIPIPKEITRANQHDVKLIWEDGHESVFLARDLRLMCPCAMCVDEMTGQRRLDPNTVAKDVRPVRIHLIGGYAMSVQWSDGHDTGIYAFDRLRKACPCCQ